MSAIKVVETTTLYKNHGKGIGYWKIELVTLPEGQAGGIITHAKGAGCKEVSSSFQSKPKNVGKANETTPLDQARSEVESRINKQLDKGYVRTQEEALAKPWWKFWSKVHESERGISEGFNRYVIYNDGNLEQLYRQLDGFIERRVY